MAGPDAVFTSTKFARVKSQGKVSRYLRLELKLHPFPHKLYTLDFKVFFFYEVFIKCLHYLIAVTNPWTTWLKGSNPWSHRSISFCATNFIFYASLRYSQVLKCWIVINIIE